MGHRSRPTPRFVPRPDACSPRPGQYGCRGCTKPRPLDINMSDAVHDVSSLQGDTGKATCPLTFKEPNLAKKQSCPRQAGRPQQGNSSKVGSGKLSVPRVPGASEAMHPNKALHVPGPSSHACIEPAPADLVLKPAGRKPLPLAVGLDPGPSLLQLRAAHRGVSCLPGAAILSGYPAAGRHGVHAACSLGQAGPPSTWHVLTMVPHRPLALHVSGGSEYPGQLHVFRCCDACRHRQGHVGVRAISAHPKYAAPQGRLPPLP